MLQFHGRQTPQFCEKFKGLKIIKAFRVKDRLKPKDIERYKVFAVLFDTYAKSKAGGTGKKFDWTLLSRIIEQVDRTVFLSGGLNKDNVLRAIKQVRPGWVDVSTSVESAPGKKDAGKMKAFVRKIRG
jgi:phosphoribosylanthranilate isomerase